MKKLIVAAAVLAAIPAFATTYTYTATAASQLNASNKAVLSMSIDDATMMLTASVTTGTSTFDGGLSINCCNAIGTQPAVWLTTSGHAVGTNSYSLDLSNLSSYDASFLSGGSYTDANSAFAALMTGLNNVNASNVSKNGVFEAWTSTSAGFTKALTVSPVPEPATYAMLALGLGLVALRARKQAR